jgi:hypothetical protein
MPSPAHRRRKGFHEIEFIFRQTVAMENTSRSLMNDIGRLEEEMQGTQCSPADGSRPQSEE